LGEKELSEESSEFDFDSNVSESAEQGNDDVIGPASDERGVNTDFNTKDNVQDDDILASSSLPSSSQDIPLDKTDPTPGPDKLDSQKRRKVIRVSAIRSGLKELNETSKPRGLFKFWKKGTNEDKNQYFQREDEKHTEWMEQDNTTSDRKKQVQIDMKRERARLRKQKSRAQKKIRDGPKNPKEKKKRVRNHNGLVKCT
jgi:hypothetical protein